MVTLPKTLNVLSTFRLTARAPVPMVSDRQTERALLRSGCLDPVKLASPMTASVLAVGTPAVQLAGLLQSPLTAPVHDVVWAKAAQGPSRARRARVFENGFMV